MAEIGMGGAAGDQQQVVLQPAAIAQHHLAGMRVDRRHFTQPYIHVALPAEDVAQRRGDVRRGQAGGGDLVEQWLEQVVVAAVDQGDMQAGAGKGAAGPQAGEAAADDEQVGNVAVWHGCSWEPGLPLQSR